MDYGGKKRKVKYVPAVTKNVDLNYFIKGETYNNSEGKLIVGPYSLTVQGSKVT